MESSATKKPVHKRQQASGHIVKTPLVSKGILIGPIVINFSYISGHNGVVELHCILQQWKSRSKYLMLW
ncbi:hypothetical protein L1987_21820 [Smallanthus sonchifolius]|uniref:Uncharacterized protein n=1 Tax=Smallanthus sonchifolius TaxID=185202 RepID=A0ACB9IFS1_9ASTR|nr:hypothetical protein L1987_21820 [Smallanthus sonchifolius]